MSEKQVEALEYLAMRSLFLGSRTCLETGEIHSATARALRQQGLAEVWHAPNEFRITPKGREFLRSTEREDVP